MMHHSRIVGGRQGVQSAVRRHYYSNPPNRSRVVGPRPPVVITAGPLLAVIPDLQHVVHVPTAHPHLEASLHDAVAHATEMLVAVVFLVVAGKVLVRYLAEARS